MKKSFILGLLLGGVSLLNAATLDECIAAYKAGALEKAETLCTKATKENPKSYDANFFLMRTNYAIGNYKKALPYAQKLEQLSTSLDDYSLSYNFLGVIYSKLGDKKQELNYSLKNLEINKKQGNRNNIGISLSNLGSYYMKINNLEEAQKYFLEALEYITDKSEIANTYNSLAVLYSNLNNQEKELEYAKKAVISAKEASDFGKYSFYLSTLASAYISNQNYDLAKSSLFEALQIAQDKGLLTQQSYALKYLGVLSKRQDDKESARKYLNQALQISKSQGNVSEIEDITFLLNKLEK